MSQDFCTLQKSCSWRFLGFLSSLFFTLLILIPNVWLLFLFLSDVVKFDSFLICFYFWFCWFLISETVSLSSFISIYFFQVSPPSLGLVLPVVTLSFLDGLPKRTCFTVKVCSCPIPLYLTMRCY